MSAISAGARPSRSSWSVASPKASTEPLVVVSQYRPELSAAATAVVSSSPELVTAAPTPIRTGSDPDLRAIRIDEQDFRDLILSLTPSFTRMHVSSAAATTSQMSMSKACAT